MSAGGIALGLWALPSWANAEASAERIDAAFYHMFPLWASARAMKRSRAGLNAFGFRRALSSAVNREVAAPNDDTLCGSAMLELSGGPLLLEVPDTPDRCWSSALMSAWTDTFAYLRTRATRGKGGRFLIVAPTWRGASGRGVRVIRAPTNEVWMPAQVLATGPADIPAALAPLDATTLTMPEGCGPAKRRATTICDPFDAANLLDVVGEMLARSPPSRTEPRRRTPMCADLCIRPTPEGVRSGLAPPPSDLQAAWAAAVPRGITRLKTALTRYNHPGLEVWSVSGPTVGDFGDDDLTRAATALGGIAALGQRKDMYAMSTRDSSGKPRAADGRYRLTAPDDVPVNAFWSVTLYAAEPDGRYFVVPNPIDLWSVCDRTPSVVRGADGGIEIACQREASTDPRVNWLPAANGAEAFVVPRLSPASGAARWPLGACNYTPPGRGHADAARRRVVRASAWVFAPQSAAHRSSIDGRESVARSPETVTDETLRGEPDGAVEIVASSGRGARRRCRDAGSNAWACEIIRAVRGAHRGRSRGLRRFRMDAIGRAGRCARDGLAGAATA
jgi:hypothetical protein